MWVCFEVAVVVWWLSICDRIGVIRANVQLSYELESIECKLSCSEIDKFAIIILYNIIVLIRPLKVSILKFAIYCSIIWNKSISNKKHIEKFTKKNVVKLLIK